MKAFRILAVAAAALCIAACGKGSWDDDPIDMRSNWWYRSNIIYGGVRSIDEGDVITEYNRQGRITKIHDDLMEKSISYNAKGLPYSIRYRNYDARGTVTYSSELHFEYYNYGKFCPVPASAGSEEFNLYDNGLLPGLSRIIWDSSDEGRIESEYIFEGNILKIVTTNVDHPEVTYDVQQIEYMGNYPRAFRGKGYFFTVTAYQANGMFDEFREGYLDNGIITNDFYYCIVRDFNEMMLIESVEETVYEASVPSETRLEEYSYNDLGDCIEVLFQAPGIKERTITSYEYDDWDNWISMTSFMRDELTGRQIGNVTTVRRVIRYY